jgi:hypothetical protein
VQDAQGNIIYPCGYRGGAKQRISAVADFEDAEVSLSSQTGIAQVDKDKEFQVIFHAMFKEGLDGYRSPQQIEINHLAAKDQLHRVMFPKYMLIKIAAQAPMKKQSSLVISTSEACCRMLKRFTKRAKRTKKFLLFTVYTTTVVSSCRSRIRP